MTIQSPQSVDQPDWFTATPYAGRPLLNLVDTGIVSHEYPWNYVATNASIMLSVVLNEGPWIVRVLWSETGSDVGDVWTEEYSGQAAVTLFDTLPVLAPWVGLRIIDPLSRGTMTATIKLYTTSTTQRGSQLHFLSSKCTHVEGGNAPGMSTTSNYGNFLSPGLYQWSFYTPNALTGQLQFVGIDYLGEVYPLVRETNPPGLVSYYGQLIVGNVQPVFQVVNTAAGAVSFNCALIGPL